jgi:hypothetical protein
MDGLQPGDPVSVSGYRLLGRLGAGGMGQVYLGVSPGGRKVAVKLIHPVHAGTAQFRERFAREIDAARKVGGFHTAPVVDADPRADPPWMVTAFIDGPSLQEAIGRDGPLPPGEVRVLGAGLAEGLAAIHAHGLVHRDLKPGNVILAADGPRIIDFGIARAVDATTGITTTGAVIGTFAYMSPEQIRGDVTGPPSDVFSLGCVLAFAATGRPPFGTDAAATVMFRIISQPPDLAGLADEDLRELITGCLAKSLADRPSVPAFLAALTDPDLVHARTRGQRLTTPNAYVQDLQTQTALSPHAPRTGARLWLPGTALPADPQQARPRRRRAGLLLALALIAAAATAVGSAIAIFLVGRPTTIRGNAPTTAATHTHVPVSSSTARSTGTASPSLPVITVGSYTGLYPGQIDFSGDSGNFVNGITWTSWTATNAIGYGKSDIDSCVPDCAEAPADFVVAIITLSDPIHGRFTLLVEKRNGTTETYHYPRVWPEDAQQAAGPVP